MHKLNDYLCRLVSTLNLEFCCYVTDIKTINHIEDILGISISEGPKVEITLKVLDEYVSLITIRVKLTSKEYHFKLSTSDFLRVALLMKSIEDSDVALSFRDLYRICLYNKVGNSFKIYNFNESVALRFEKDEALNRFKQDLENFIRRHKGHNPSLW